MLHFKFCYFSFYSDVLGWAFQKALEVHVICVYCEMFLFVSSFL